MPAHWLPLPVKTKQTFGAGHAARRVAGFGEIAQRRHDPCRIVQRHGQPVDRQVALPGERGGEMCAVAARRNDIGIGGRGCAQRRFGMCRQDQNLGRPSGRAVGTLDRQFRRLRLPDDDMRIGAAETE
jgi:hypothetical protein